MKSTTEYCKELYQLEFLNKITNNSQLVNFEISRYTHDLRLYTTATATQGSWTADSTRKVSNNPNPNLAQHTTRISPPTQSLAQLVISLGISLLARPGKLCNTGSGGRVSYSLQLPSTRSLYFCTESAVLYLVSPRTFCYHQDERYNEHRQCK